MNEKNTEYSIESKPIALKSLFKPVVWFVIISVPLFVNMILLRDKIFGLFIVLFIFYIPYSIYIIIYRRKPNTLISKSKDSFIIHKNSQNISVTLKTIKSISSNTFPLNNDLYIKTDTKKYRITDVRRIDYVEMIMRDILRDYKYNNHKNTDD